LYENVRKGPQSGDLRWNCVNVGISHRMDIVEY